MTRTFLRYSINNVIVKIWDILEGILKDNIDTSGGTSDGFSSEVEMSKELSENIWEQLNCHFIFNALNAIKCSIITGKDNSCDLINDIADYMRYRIRFISKVEMVSFDEELQHIESYINLEKARFSCLNIRSNIEDTNFALPAMSVIFLIENAIHHGVIKKDGEGIINIKTYRDKRSHCIEVCDNGTVVVTEDGYPGESKDDIGNIGRLAKRIEVMTGGSLELISNFGKGTRALIRIPLDR